jgi:hypothetical protein
MSESGYGPQFYKEYGYNKSRDVVSQRKREWEGLVFPHLELKKPYQHKNFYDMIYAFDSYSAFPDYPKSRQEIVIPVWTPIPMIPVDLIATSSSSGGVSTVWSDAFTGTNGESVNPAKWTFVFGDSATIQSNQACLDPKLTTYPGFGAAYMAYMCNKAPNWENYSASVYVPTGSEIYGGAAIGWWVEGIIWGIVYGWGAAAMGFITPAGLVLPGPPIFMITPFWLKVVKTPTSASGYYKYGTEDWILISTYPFPPSTPVYIGGATDGYNPPSRHLLKYFDDFEVSFAAVSVDLQWTADAPSFVLQRNGATIYSGPLKAYTDTAVASATTYLYEITAYDVKGNRIGYDQQYATTP